MNNTDLFAADLQDEFGETFKLDLPEALPLYSPHKKLADPEPEVRYKFARLSKKKPREDAEEEKKEELEEQQKKPLFCKHLKVTGHICEDCKEHIVGYENIFDTGNVGTFVNIKYINDYWDCLDEEELMRLKKYSITVFENYKPKNSQEMREYMLYVLDKSLKKLQKYETQVPSICAQFGSIGKISELSDELKSYLQLKKTRELQVLGVDQPPDAENDITIGPNCLLFDSIFESGNLERAEYLKQTEYNLYLNVDTNTKGHQQWFYFKVKNTRKNKRYTFNIKNFTKPFSLHRSGMQIMMRSKKQRKMTGCDDWLPTGYNICYQRSEVQRSGWRVPGPINIDDEEDDDQILDDIHGVDGMVLAQNNKNKPRNSIIHNQLQNQAPAKRKKRYFYTLSFEIEFEHDNDHVYLAYSTPYSYSQIFYHMLELEQNIIQSHQMEQDFRFSEDFKLLERYISTNDIIYERKMLCKTISGLPVPVVTITAKKNKGQDFKKRKAICITSRVHPGETNSNFVYDGFIENLLDYTTSSQLLDYFVFKLIPCLNPDGVICGNYRSSLAGVDLNRQWILPNKDIHPTIFSTKELFSQISKERQLLVFCDLHCHSKKKNSFIYGCNTAANGGFTSWTKVRLLPRIFAKLTALFNIRDCRFRIDPSKLGTARVIVWKEFGVTNSFTLENSFYGFQIGKKVQRFIPQLYKEVGENLLRSMNEYRILSKQIEKEIALTNGWLKPKLLLEITGTPAAEKMAKEMEQKQKEEKRKKLINEYKANMGFIVEPEPEDQVSVQFNFGKNMGKSRNWINGQMDSDVDLNNKLLPKKMLTQNQVGNLSEKVLNIEGLKKDTSNNSGSLRRGTIFSEHDAGLNNNFADIGSFTPQQVQKIVKIQGKIKNYLSVKRQSEQSSLATLEKLTPHKRKCSFELGINRDESQSDIALNVRQNIRQRSKSLHDWRQYFEQDELESAYKQIEEGEDPNEHENISVSDECASEDNFDVEDLYQEVYLKEGNAMKKEIQMKKKAEKQYLEEIKELIEENLSDNNSKSQEQVPSQFQQTPLACQKTKPFIQGVLPFERSQINGPGSSTNQQQNNTKLNTSFQLSNQETRQSQDKSNKKPRETMVKLLNVLTSSSNRRKTFDPILNQKSYNNQQRQGGEQKSFIVTNNINQPVTTDYQEKYTSVFKLSQRPSSQFSVNGQSTQGNTNNYCVYQHSTVEYDQLSILEQQKSLERTPICFKGKVSNNITPIKTMQDPNTSINSAVNQTTIGTLINQSEVVRSRKNNFQQYLMKNLRYEDARIQNVYTQISNNKVSRPIQTNQVVVKKSNEEFARLKSRNGRREDPYKPIVQPQQLQVQKINRTLFQQQQQLYKLQLPSIGQTSNTISGGKQKLRKGRAPQKLALQGINAFSGQNSQVRNQANSNMISNRSFNQMGYHY